MMLLTLSNRLHNLHSLVLPKIQSDMTRNRILSAGNQILRSLFILLFAINSGVQAAECGNFDGRGIIKRVIDRNLGDRSIQLSEMTLTNDKGLQRVRKIKSLHINTGDGMERRLIRFLSPADMRDTTFLNIERKEEQDEQYLFLPAYNRTKRISNTDRGRSFMGTDYTYEDILHRKLNVDQHVCLGTDRVQGWDTFMVESVPVDGSISQYGKMIRWVDQHSFVIVRGDFYDKDGRLMKRLRVDALKNIDGVWVPTDSIMENLPENHSTRIEVTDLAFDNENVTEGMFTVSAIKRRRFPDVH